MSDDKMRQEPETGLITEIWHSYTDAPLMITALALAFALPVTSLGHSIFIFFVCELTLSLLHAKGREQGLRQAREDDNAHS